MSGKRNWTGFAWMLAALFAAGATQAWSEDGKAVTVSANGQAVLSLQLPAGGSAKPALGATVIAVPSQGLSFEVWTVADAKAIADAIPRVADVIKPVFLGFKPSATNDLTIAGAPAKHLLSSGTEADDGDPGKAEVVLFAVGGRVFAASAHGEGDYASLHRKAMLDVLATAKAP